MEGLEIHEYFIKCHQKELYLSHGNAKVSLAPNKLGGELFVTKVKKGQSMTDQEIQIEGAGGELDMLLTHRAFQLSLEKENVQLIFEGNQNPEDQIMMNYCWKF